eukprot:SAG31_NODE_33167_length_347_cov_0.625000_2_plen_46_part_01
MPIAQPAQLVGATLARLDLNPLALRHVREKYRLQAATGKLKSELEV